MDTAYTMARAISPAHARGLTMAKQGVVTLTKTGGVVSVVVQGYDPIIVDTGPLDPSVLTQAAMHGIGQKLVDAAALSRNPENGQAASVAEKYAAIKAVADRLNAGGAWNTERGEGVARGGLLFAAMSRLYPGKFADAEAFGQWTATMATASKSTQKSVEAALRASAKVAPVIATIRAEREAQTVAAGGSPVAVADMLAELDAE